MQQRLMVCVLLFVFAACSEEHSSASEAVIGPSGGSLALENGARLDVPAGAVDVPTRFTARLGVADGLPSLMTAAGQMVTFGPEGTTFAEPVRLTLLSDGEPTVLLTRANASSEWARVDGAVFDAARGVVTAEVTHFSDFVPATRGVPADPDAGEEPDAGIPAVSGACTDPVGDTGCGAGEHCVVRSEDGPGGDGPVDIECVATGTGAEGDACLDATECGAGLSCAAIAGTSGAAGEESHYYFTTFEGFFIRGGGICSRICSRGDWSMAECDAGDLCHAIGAGGALIGYGVCHAPADARP
jgi:hypothetical protein